MMHGKVGEWGLQRGKPRVLSSSHCSGQRAVGREAQQTTRPEWERGESGQQFKARGSWHLPSLILSHREVSLGGFWGDSLALSQGPRKKVRSRRGRAICAMQPSFSYPWQTHSWGGLALCQGPTRPTTAGWRLGVPGPAPWAPKPESSLPGRERAVSGGWGGRAVGCEVGMAFVSRQVSLMQVQRRQWQCRGDGVERIPAQSSGRTSSTFHGQRVGPCDTAAQRPRPGPSMGQDGGGPGSVEVDDLPFAIPAVPDAGLL